MSYSTYCRFIFSLIYSIFILNINTSFAGIPNYGCFSLSGDTEKKGYKLAGVKKKRNNIWIMPGTNNHSFNIMDKEGKNGVIIKVEGKYKQVCTRFVNRCHDFHNCDLQCTKFKTAWAAHIVAVRTSKGKGLNIKGCGISSKNSEYPCCKLSITDKK